MTPVPRSLVLLIDAGPQVRCTAAEVLACFECFGGGDDATLPAGDSVSLAVALEAEGQDLRVGIARIVKTGIIGCHRRVDNCVDLGVLLQYGCGGDIKKIVREWNAEARNEGKLWPRK